VARCRRHWTYDGVTFTPAWYREVKATASGSEATMAEKDPVCGMMVEPEGAAATSEHEGKTYYFCSADCKEEFDSDPESYT
jgi:YHS domain-containing protein